MQPISRRATVLGSAAILASGLISFVAPVSAAFATPLEEKRAEAQMALNKIKKIESEIDEASARYNMALLEKEKAEERMAQIQSRVDAANKEISLLQQRISTRIKGMYKNGNASMLDVLLGSETFDSFATGWDLLTDLSEEDAALIEEVKALRSKTASEYDLYESQQKEADELLETAKQLKADAKKLLKEAEETYDQLNSEVETLLAEEEAAAEAAMQAEILKRLENGEDVDASGLNINNKKPQTVDGKLVVQRARREIGKPYVWGACGPSAFDCSGLVSYCLTGEYGRRVGTTYTFYDWTRVTQPKPGDICVSWTHCGIYIGNGQMIHAPNHRKLVQISSVHSNMIFVRY